MYMQVFDKFSEREGIGISALHTLVASAKTILDRRLIGVHEFIKEQAKDLYCPSASFTARLLGSMVNYDSNGFLIYTAPIDEELQKDAPMTLLAYLLYHSPHPALTGPPRERSIYNSMHR